MFMEKREYAQLKVTSLHVGKVDFLLNKSSFMRTTLFIFSEHVILK